MKMIENSTQMICLL